MTLSKLLAASLLCFVGLACETTTVNDRPKGNVITPNPKGNVPSVSDGRPMTADEVLQSDPCAARLHDIEGALLIYYAVHKSLPETLDKLKEVDEGELVLTCPATNKPYLYFPAGIRAPGRNKLILVADPSPAHKSKRWCILIPDAPKSTARATEVLDIPEPVFLSYQLTN